MDLTFDRAEVEVAADTAVSLVFENRESTPHNVAAYVDASADEALLVGEINPRRDAVAWRHAGFPSPPP